MRSTLLMVAICFAVSLVTACAGDTARPEKITFELANDGKEIRPHLNCPEDFHQEEDDGAFSCVED
jgi:hypothetical protein